MKLYDIPFEMATIEQTLRDSAGELTPELEQQINALLVAGKDKIESAAMVVRTLEAEAEACEAEAKRLQERCRSLTNSAARLKSLMVVALDAAFGGKVKTSLFTIYAQSSAPTMQFVLQPGVDELALIQTAPWAVRVKVELNKKELSERIKAGEAIPDGLDVIEQPGTRFLRIR